MCYVMKPFSVWVFVLNTTGDLSRQIQGFPCPYYPCHSTFSLILFPCSRLVYLSWLKDKAFQSDEIQVRCIGCVLKFAHCRSSEVCIHKKFGVLCPGDKRWKADQQGMSLKRIQDVSGVLEVTKLHSTLHEQNSAEILEVVRLFLSVLGSFHGRYNPHVFPVLMQKQERRILPPQRRECWLNVGQSCFVGAAFVCWLWPLFPFTLVFAPPFPSTESLKI